MPSPRRTLLASMLVSAALVATVDAGSKRVVPTLLSQARYVCLGYDVGSGFLSDTQAISSPTEVFPEDRRALEAIRQELERWGKYAVTVRPEQAELLIAVRSGRRAGVGIGVGIGRDRSGGRSQGGLAGGEISSPDDLLVVYEARGGRPGAQLWRKQGRGVLEGMPPRAFDELKADIEKAAPTPEPAAPPK